MAGTATGDPVWFAQYAQMLGPQAQALYQQAAAQQMDWNPQQMPAHQWAQWMQTGNIAHPDPEAEKTAESLLLRHLSDEQRASWEKHKGFWVTAGSGTRYWLDGQRPRSVPTEGPPQSHCIDSFDENGVRLPKCDQILAQKLLIETDEPRFLKTANAARI